MKSLNIFKKETSKEVKSNIQKLDKIQLSKVIGGGDGTIIDETTSTSGSETKHDIALNAIRNMK